MKILSVIPLKKGILRGDLTYFTSLPIPAGHIVSVPLRNKKTIALVSSSEDLKENKAGIKDMNFNLRKVTEDLGPSLFRPEYLESIFETSDYFVQNKNSALTALIPKIFIEKYDKLAKLIKEAPAKKSSEDTNNIKPEKLIFQHPFRDRISIYKTLVRESFARGKSIFLVLPTESDILKFEESLSKGIKPFTFCLWSGLPASKIVAATEKILSSDHPMLILGTAPYLSIPKNNIGTIILEHESSNAYRMIGRPYFDLRVFIELYAAKLGAKFILADEMLRLETVGRKDLDGLATLYPLSFRIDFDGEIRVIPNEETERHKKFRIFKEESVLETENALARKQNVFIFALRKGLATQTLCKDCGNTVSCESCGSPLVLYSSHQGQKRVFICNHCQEDKPGDTVCGNCGSWNLIPLGIGTDTVEAEAERLFPKTKIWKLDKETAKNAKGAKDIIRAWQNEKGAILIGTEMSFFYLPDSIPLSIIASFDSLWSIPNFKMSEKIIQIILSAILHTERKLLIQSKNSSDNILRAVASGNLMHLVREELEDRKNFDYPPYKRFIKITFSGDKEGATRARKFFAETFTAHNPEIFSGFASKDKGRYATNALLKLEPKEWSLPLLTPGGNLDQGLLALLKTLSPNFDIAVDPEDLL